MSFLFDMGGRWHQVTRNDPRARRLVDGESIGKAPHYSRQTPGAMEFMSSGKTLVLLTDDELAVWGCIEQRDPAGGHVWRNSVFRNEGAGLSSALIAEATYRTFSFWARHYGLPPEGVWLRTEIDPTQIRSTNPGYCYKKVGWRKVGVFRGLVHLRAPGLARAAAEANFAAEAA
jgi:hypothetical protein